MTVTPPPLDDDSMNEQLRLFQQGRKALRKSATVFSILLLLIFLAIAVTSPFIFSLFRLPEWVGLFMTAGFFLLAPAAWWRTLSVLERRHLPCPACGGQANWAEINKRWACNRCGARFSI